jgi:hypothetical protein
MNKNLIIFISFFLFFFSYSINSLEDASTDNKQTIKNNTHIIETIDKLLKNRDLTALNNYLMQTKNNDNYHEIEDYILSEVKKLILKGEYKYTKSIIAIILKNNMDNSEAQEIYLSLDMKEKKEKKIKITFDNFLIACDFGAIDFMIYQSQFYNDYYDTTKINSKYGMSTDFAFYFNHPYFSTGIEFYIDSSFASLYPEESGTSIFYKIIFPSSTPFIKIPLYFSFGMAQQIFYFPEDTAVDVFITNLISPIIGLKFTRWFFHKYIGIDASIHYYLISPFTSYFDAAFDTRFSLLCRFYQYKRIGFIIRTDIIAFFLIGEGKLENNIKFQISFGIGINEK